MMMHRLILLAALCFVIAHPVTTTAQPRSQLTWPPKLLLNSDCGTPVFYRFDAPMHAKQLCHVLDDLPGTLIDAFLPCPQFSDDQFWFPTKVAEPYDGRHVKDGKYEDKYFKRVANNVRSLNERKLDPMKVWERRTKEHGFWFIPTLRMNDIHKDYVKLWPSLRSHWEQQRSHLAIGKAIPPWYTAPYKYSFALDYKHKEVRQRKLDIITEICTRYDVDGFEMDFLRHIYFFRHGEEKAGIAHMNRFVQAVRKRLDEIGQKKGKRLRLLVRVPPHLPKCTRIGLDVPTWIKNRWVDMVIPMAGGYLDMDADVASFVQLAKGTPCVIAGGLEYYVRGYRKPEQKGITWASLEMLRAGAATAWKQGATSIYLFNYDCHGPFPFRGRKRQALQEIGNPRKLQGKDKRYLLTVDMNRRTPESGGEKQLPVELSAKQSKRTLRFFVADDLDRARKEGTLKSIEMNVWTGLAKHLTVRVNGQVVPPTKVAAARLQLAPHVKQGINQLELEFQPPQTKAKARVTGVDVWVRYRTSK